MTETARISARSNHGCWTCRLRKKKCDENRPICSACISLELECHGYGPRPEWMDNGVLQRDQACKFKRLVSQAKSKKGRRQQFLNSPKSPFGMRSSTSTKNISSPAPVSQNFFDEHHLGTFPQLEDDLNSAYHDSGIGSSTSIESLWNFWPQNDLSMMNDASMDLEGYASAYTTGRNQHSPPHLVSPMAFENIISGKDIPSPIDQSSSSSLNELQDSLSQNHRYQSKEPATTANYYDPVGSSQTTNPNADTEDALFMYYLDEVFFIQHPFFYSQKKQGRGWLFAILRRVKSVYHAALALSERQILSSSSSQSRDISSSLIKLRAPNSHYDIAIQQMQVMINDSDASKSRGILLHNIEILMSILQLLFIETFNGGREKWQTHLRTASEPISTVLQARIALMTTSEEPIASHVGKETAAPCPEIESAFKFVLGSLIAFDILSSASTRSSLILNINHLQVLETFDISLERHTGCRESVMALILEISLLDRWKKEAQGVNRLSFVELVKRGDGLQNRLRQELAEIDTRTNLNPWSTRESSPVTTDTHPEISKLFILSAITYLHVVISGPYPEVPEIAESVLATVHTFQGLRDPRLLRNLVWPFCVSGCLALEKHYDFFRGLVSRAGITPYATGVCFEALQIMEECWKARITCSESCDWASAMQRRGCYVFLG